MKSNKLTKLADYLDSRRGTSSESDRLRTAETNASQGSRAMRMNSGVNLNDIATKRQKFSEMQLVDDGLDLNMTKTSQLHDFLGEGFEDDSVFGDEEPVFDVESQEFGIDDLSQIDSREAYDQDFEDEDLIDEDVEPSSGPMDFPLELRRLIGDESQDVYDQEYTDEDIHDEDQNIFSSSKFKQVKLAQVDYDEDFEDDLFDDFSIEEPEECQTCGGTLKSLGKLGRLEWFRCENCGAESSKSAEQTL